MHFTFENPIYLWYLASLPLLIITHFLALHGAKRKAMKFANFQALKRVAGKKFVTKNVPVLLMRILVLTLLILSASGVRLWYATTQAENNYVLAIDVSSSMTAKDFDPSRLEVAKAYSLRFIDTLESPVKVAVITFSGVTMVEQTLTSDRAALKSAINDITITKAGGTDIPGALITGTNLLLTDPDKGRVMVVFTDGSSTLGNFIDNSMKLAVDYVRDHEVIVNAVGIGTESGPIGYLPEYYNISAVFDTKNLHYITNETGGRMISAVDNDDLEAAYLELLEKSEEGFLSVRVDLALLVGSLVLLFIEWGLINSRYRRIT